MTNDEAKKYLESALEISDIIADAARVVARQATVEGARYIGESFFTFALLISEHAAKTRELLKEPDAPPAG